MNNQSSCIYSINSKQLNKISNYKEKWLNIAQESEAASPEELRHAIYYLYQAIGLDFPKFRTFISPQILQHALENEDFRRRTLFKFFVEILLSIYAVAIFIWFNIFLIVLPCVIFTSIKSVFFSTFIFAMAFMILDTDSKEIHPHRFRRLSRFIDLIKNWSFIIYLVTVVPINLLISEYSWNSGNFTLTIYYTVGIISSYWAIKFDTNKNLFANRWKTLLEKQIQDSLDSEMYQQAWKLFKDDWAKSWETVGKIIAAEEDIKFPSDQYNLWRWIQWFAWADFCITELECNCDHQLWQSLHIVMTSCSTIIAEPHICYISDRPLHIHIDDQTRLHAKDKPAVSFADNNHLYYLHGILRYEQPPQSSEPQMSHPEPSPLQY